MSRVFKAVVVANIVNDTPDGFRLKVGDQTFEAPISQIRYISTSPGLDFHLTGQVQFSEQLSYPRLVGACDGYVVLQLAAGAAPVVCNIPDAVVELERAGVPLFARGAADE